MDTVITESWVTLNSRFLGENIVVLSLKVTNNFLEATYVESKGKYYPGEKQTQFAYHRSLSILSPKPGVSTIVREILSWVFV